MNTSSQSVASKYIKPAREQKLFYFAAVAFLFTMYVLPQYFGLPFPLFDLTALRIMIIVLVILIVGENCRWNDFVHVILTEPVGLVLLPYLFVIGYTMVLRVDINAFLNPFIEIMTFYLVIYVIRHSLGIEKTVQLMIGFMYFITVLGVIEYVMGRSPFSYLETISGIYTGQFVRSGNYRIMSSAVHSLGYGLILVSMVPFACIDLEKNEINLLKRPVLLVLIVMNAFLCGSRSTLSVVMVAIVLLMFLSHKTQTKRLILVGGMGIIAFLMFLLVFHSSSIGQYIMLQITSILDSLLGTEFSVAYGADLSALSSSSNYRDQLKYIFTLDWLNPFLGIGRSRGLRAEINGSYIKSVDDFYVAEFIRYAYPGLFAYGAFMLYCLYITWKKGFKGKSALAKGILVGMWCYMLNLKWVDSLQTLKYFYLLFAIVICIPVDVGMKQEKKKETPSKYIKKLIGKEVKDGKSKYCRSDIQR